jgi:hypothetical protein
MTVQPPVTSFISPAKRASRHRFQLRILDERIVLCLLKNSLTEIVLKKHRARMPNKRSSPAAYTFLVTHFGLVFRKIDFFNTHS